jgi:environmental stress-induced protein Ves
MHRHDTGAALHRFSRGRLRAAPWKNGGGATREIACWPPGSGLDDFDWRASIATIATSGPFSVFPGVERTIVLLDGPGVLLRAAPDARGGGGDGERFEHRLDRRYEPLDFSGDLALDGTLLPVDPQVHGGAGGDADALASIDFNVMSRRGRCRADVRVVHAAQSLAGAAHGLLMSLRGNWHLRLRANDGGANDGADAPCAERSRSGADETLSPGEGLWWADTSMGWDVSPGVAGADPDAGDARLIAVRWTFVLPKADARSPLCDFPFSDSDSDCAP